MQQEHIFLTFVLGVATSVIADLISAWLREWINDDQQDE